MSMQRHWRLDAVGVDFPLVIVRLESIDRHIGIAWSADDRNNDGVLVALTLNGYKAMRH